MTAAVLGAAVVLLATAGWTPASLPWRHRPVVSRAARRTASSPLLVADADDAPDADVSLDAKLQKMQVDKFNSELYSHLSKRPEYETTEMYSSLRKRIDVEDPLYNELKRRREMLENAPEPCATQTPGEVIELVLRALRDVDWPRENHGAELLRSYSGPASILGDGRPDVTAKMLVDYFASSKYSILLDWVSLQYRRKLAISFDKKRALQQLILTSSSGESVPVTFQLSKHPTADGEEVWLIDQLLVKSCMHRAAHRAAHSPGCDGMRARAGLANETTYSSS